MRPFSKGGALWCTGHISLFCFVFFYPKSCVVLFIKKCICKIWPQGSICPLTSSFYDGALFPQYLGLYDKFDPVITNIVKNVYHTLL